MDRLDLRDKLRDLVGSKNVYFQPPEGTRLSYPCIIYHLSGRKSKYANDDRYKNEIAYDIQIIDEDPDSLLPERLENAFTYASFSRFFVVDNLNHWAYRIYLGGIK